MLCDVARIEGGKLYILGGGWGRLIAKSLPLTYPLQIATQFHLPIEIVPESIEVELQVGLESGDEPDQQTSRIALALTVPAESAPDAKYLEITALIGAQVEFRREGRYKAALFHEQQEIVSLLFRVQHMPDVESEQPITQEAG